MVVEDNLFVLFIYNISVTTTFTILLLHDENMMNSLNPYILYDRIERTDNNSTHSKYVVLETHMEL